MARVRRDPDDAATTRHAVVDPTQIPERLATWFWDDWVPDDEPVSAQLGRDYASERERREAAFSSRVLLSRRRFLEAQRAWAADLEARGLTPPPLPRPGQPRRRHPLRSNP